MPGQKDSFDFEDELEDSILDVVEDDEEPEDEDGEDKEQE